MNVLLRDINEYETAIDNCDHISLKTIGSFQCACQSGHTLNTLNNGTCNDMLIGLLINTYSFLYKLSMSVMKRFLIVVNYVSTLLEAMFVLVSLDINFVMTTTLSLIMIC